jgi:hypothetical membrane protein
MSELITAPGAGARAADSERTATRVTRTLLACGVVAGPFFFVMVAIQMLVRPGFDIRRHPLSLLSLGDLGWIQMATFVLTGLGTVACAVGIRRVLRSGLGGTWGPRLVGLLGLGLVAAGFFTADPSLGFPPGAPQGPPAHMSWHSVLHGVAFFTAFTSVTVACVVLARRFAALGQRGWLAYCVASAVIAPALVALGMGDQHAAGVAFALAAAVAFGWVAALALQLLSEQKRAG